ncbi:site-specific integrase [Methylotenera sp.]|uniref:site-specific integrase n=1 Tax=Methylotenera sp. TaxID=2051956 RepID=UPI0025F0FE0D|nr:site-specific integrase [Methylotenera sp.]
MSLSNTIYFDNVSKVQLIALKSDFEKYINAALASSTRSSYQSDLAHFISWGGTIPSTPEIISQYLAVHADLLAPATLSRRVVSINRAHTSQNLPSPTKSDLVKATLRGIKRTVSTKQRQVEPILKNNLCDMVAGLEGVKGCRDKALLLIGFSGAFRRSELVSLQHSDIEFVEHGLVVHLRKSKTDQLGEGRKIGIPYARGAVCPVLALKEWLKLSEISEGALFRPVTRHGRIENINLSTQAVAIIVKERAKAIGLDASKFSGHSLRAGLVTSAAQAGVSSWKIRQQTGHKSDAMLNRYIRDARLFIDNAAGLIF